MLIIARLLPMDRAPTDPHIVERGAVAVADGAILAVGSPESCRAALPAEHELIEARSAALLPGFIDPHVHVLAAAAAERSVDCSPRSVESVADILDAIRNAARELPEGKWVRAVGYEETMLRERRHPTRRELDRAGLDHPVRLVHRTGHGEVLNSLALALVGIDEQTPEAASAVFGRSLADGRLDGLLLGMTDAIEAAMTRTTAAEVAGDVRAWAAARAAEGVTTMVDAGARNTVDTWSTFERLVTDEVLPQDIVLMEPVDAPGTLPDGALDGRLCRGESKLMLAALEGDDGSGFDPEAIAARIEGALSIGRRVAVHAPTSLAVRATLEAFERADAPPGQRLEHAPLLDARLLQAVARAGAFVVAQPGLLGEVPARYQALIPPAEQANLQPWRVALDLGVALAFSSDAPVSRAGTLAAAGAASVDRPRELAPEQAITPLEALHAWTAGAAKAAGLADRGQLAPGLRADLVLVDGPIDRDPAACEVRWTMIGGRIWSGNGRSNEG